MVGRFNIEIPIAISLGAIAGALSRSYLGQWLGSLWLLHFPAHPFPMGTLLVNLSGCGLMGFIATSTAARRSLPTSVLLLLTTGFLGSYTTFSTYGLEALTLFTTGQPWEGLLYWLGSPLLGLLGCMGGIFLAHRVK